MKWDQIADISTIIGVFIATLTLVSGYRLYKISKKDDYLKQIRNILISFKFNSDSLNQTLTYEIVNEIVSTVIYSEFIKKNIEKIYSDFFEEKGKSIEELKDYLAENIKPITVPIHSQSVNEFKKGLKSNSELSSQVFTDYPAMYRVMESAIFLFNRILDFSKHLAREEDLFKELIQDAFDDKDVINSIDDLQEYVFHGFMSVIIQKQGKADQKDVDDMLEIIGLMVNAYMRLNDKQLFVQKLRERKVRFNTIDQAESMFDLLLDAEKGLKLIMKESELLAFRELSTRIKVRNEEVE